MKKVNTRIGRCYVLVAKVATVVTAEVGGEKYTLLAHPGGGVSRAFVAVATTAELSGDAPCVVTEVASFSAALINLAAGEGVLEVVACDGVGLNRELVGGKLYKLSGLTDGDMSGAIFRAPAGVCWTCEIGLDLTGVADGIVWPAGWVWVDAADGLPPAKLAVGKVHYFALRSEGGRTYINRSYEL